MTIKYHLNIKDEDSNFIRESGSTCYGRISTLLYQYAIQTENNFEGITLELEHTASHRACFSGEQRSDMEQLYVDLGLAEIALTFGKDAVKYTYDDEDGGRIQSIFFDSKRVPFYFVVLATSPFRMLDHHQEFFVAYNILRDKGYPPLVCYHMAQVFNHSQSTVLNKSLKYITGSVKFRIRNRDEHMVIRSNGFKEDSFEHWYKDVPQDLLDRQVMYDELQETGNLKYSGRNDFSTGGSYHIERYANHRIFRETALIVGSRLTIETHRHSYEDSAVTLTTKQIHSICKEASKWVNSYE